MALLGFHSESASLQVLKNYRLSPIISLRPLAKNVPHGPKDVLIGCII